MNIFGDYIDICPIGFPEESCQTYDYLLITALSTENSSHQKILEIYSLWLTLWLIDLQNSKTELHGLSNYIQMD